MTEDLHGLYGRFEFLDDAVLRVQLTLKVLEHGASFFVFSVHQAD
jgi:hypothetical protein